MVMSIESIFYHGHATDPDRVGSTQSEATASTLHDLMFLDWRLLTVLDPVKGPAQCKCNLLLLTYYILTLISLTAT